MTCWPNFQCRDAVHYGNANKTYDAILWPQEAIVFIFKGRSGFFFQRDQFCGIVIGLWV